MVAHTTATILCAPGALKTAPTGFKAPKPAPIRSKTSRTPPKTAIHFTNHQISTTITTTHFTPTEKSELQIWLQIQRSSDHYQPPSDAEQMEIDRRTIHVANLDYSTTSSELLDYFKICGAIKSVTIPTDKRTGFQKNHGFVEFKEAESVELAMECMDQSIFRMRRIRVNQKRFQPF